MVYVRVERSERSEHERVSGMSGAVQWRDVMRSRGEISSTPTVRAAGRHGVPRWPCWQRGPKGWTLEADAGS